MAKPLDHQATIKKMRRLLESTPGQAKYWTPKSCPRGFRKGVEQRYRFFQWVSSHNFFGFGGFGRLANAISKGTAIPPQKRRTRKEISAYLERKYGADLARAFLRQTDVHELTALRNVLPGHKKIQLTAIVGLTLPSISNINHRKTSFPPSPHEIFHEGEELAGIASKGGKTYSELLDEIKLRTGLRMSYNGLIALRTRLRKQGLPLGTAFRPPLAPRTLPFMTPQLQEKYMRLLGYARTLPNWRPRNIPQELHPDFQQDASLALYRLAQRVDFESKWKGYVGKRLLGAVKDFNKQRLRTNLALNSKEARVLLSALKHRGRGKTPEQIADMLKLMDGRKKTKYTPDYIRGLIEAFDTMAGEIKYQGNETLRKKIE